MADCPVELKGPIQQDFPDGPALVFKLVPEGYAFQHDCTLSIRINGVEVTGTGDFGGCHVSGKTFDAIVIQPVPKYIREVEFNLRCGNCSYRRTAHWGKFVPEKKGPGFVPMLLLKLFLVFVALPLMTVVMVFVFTIFGLAAPLIFVNELIRGKNPMAMLELIFGGAWKVFGKVFEMIWKGLTAPF